MAVNEREIILDSLLEINEKGALSHIVLGAVLEKYDYLPDKSKAFIKKVTEGTVEKQISIDKAINRYSKLDAAKLKPVIRTLLRMSIYQILYLDRVPDSAVCNEAVKLAKKRGFKTLSGYVNGVLRNVCKNKDTQDNASSDIPEWITDHLVQCYGQEKAGLMIGDIQKVHPVSVRVRKDGADMSVLKPSGILPFAYYLKEKTAPAHVRGYEEGAFVIQDIAGMHVALMGEIKPGQRVLDVCASPGMKAIHAFDMGGCVTACDISEKKVDMIRKSMERCIESTKDHYMETEVADATVFLPQYAEAFDVVIADVPCSGLGVMGRKSDIRHKTKKEDLDSLPEYQKKILDNVVNYVKKGGRLIYSTCTMNPKENEENVLYLTQKYDFALKTQRQFLPGIDNTDGFFIAVCDRER